MLLVRKHGHLITDVAQVVGERPNDNCNLGMRVMYGNMSFIILILIGSKSIVEGYFFE